MKVKIACFIKNYLPISETFIYDEIVNLKKFEAIVLTEKLIDNGYFPYPKIFQAPVSSPWKPFKRKINDNFFKRALLDKNIRIVHARFAWSGMEILSVCKKLNLPLVTSFYGIDVSRLPRHFIYRQRLRKLFHEGQIFLVQSKDMKEDIVRLGCPEKKAVVLYAGIDTEKFKLKKNKPDREIKLLMCGRFVEKKGFEYGIRAFAKVAKTYKEAVLYIIGEGELEEKLKELSNLLNLSSRVKFLGTLTHQQVQKQMEESDIFLAPSITAKNKDKEGIPNVIKEAMATGLPVVSTYHAGIPELVVDSKTGFLVPEKDIDKLSDRLSYLIEHPKIGNKMGEEGREIVVKKFNLSKQIEKLEKIYQRLLNES